MFAWRTARALWTNVNQACVCCDRYVPSMRAFREICSSLRSRLRPERGFALIEVVVSAALLLVVAGGVLAGIEGPSMISGKNEVRGQAAALAQQDQERMRAMPFSSLIGYTQTTPVTVQGVTYSRYSKASWVRDNNDTDSCTIPGDDTSGDYLKIVSRVTAPGGQTPVQLDSLLAQPPGGGSTKGTLAVQLKDQLDQPVVGQSVSIAGPESQTASTNSVGCAVFGLVQQGTYTITFSRTGWVDPSAINAVSRTTSVTAGSTTIVNHSYAQAGHINVAVDTKVGAAAAAASPAKAVMVANGGIPAGTLTFPAPAAPAQGSSSFALDVFPFPSGYGVWAGTCTSGDPTKYGLPGVTAAPGPGATVAVTVRQPAITITGATGVPGVSPATYATPSGSHLVYTSIDPGCGEKRSQNTTAANGVMSYPGMPYGNYKLCGDQGSTWAQRDTFLNNVAVGQSTTIGYKGSSGGPCS
jgi:Tfp pilus assembly protein PilV